MKVPPNYFFFRQKIELTNNKGFHCFEDGQSNIKFIN
mgnify:CR=1 FL=1